MNPQISHDYPTSIYKTNLDNQKKRKWNQSVGVKVKTNLIQEAVRKSTDAKFETVESVVDKLTRSVLLQVCICY